MLVLVLATWLKLPLALVGRLAGVIIMLSPVQSIIAKGLWGLALNEPRRGPGRCRAGVVGTLNGLASGPADGAIWALMVTVSRDDSDGWRRRDCGRVVADFGTSSSSVVSP